MILTNSFAISQILPQHNLSNTNVNRNRIDRGHKQISVKDMIVITTKPGGTLKVHKHEAIREQIDETLISGREKLVRKTASSHQMDNTKYDDGITVGGHARVTAGGGRGYLVERMCR